MSFQYLNDLHVLHYGRAILFRIKVECLCGFEVEASVFSTRDAEAAVECHIRHVKDLEARAPAIR